VSGNGLHIWWILSRGTGIAAILLAGLSVMTGLLAGRGRPFKLGRFTDIKPLHEALSMATVVLILSHGLLLVGDPWLKPGLAGIAVPFQLSYRTFWTGIGIVAGWGIVLLGLSYYARRWIGPNRWRIAHRFIALFWILGIFHTFGAGTDAGSLWLQIPVAATALPALVLLGMRMGKRPATKRQAAGASRLTRAT
jgi:sulfoxide reductase heme-binding subunit YedZ